MKKHNAHCFNSYKKYSAWYIAVCLFISLSAVVSISAQEASSPKPDKQTAPVQARIVVNVPAYQISFYRGDKLVKSYPVTIGSRDYSSPYGVERQAIQIVWNPGWTPPDSDWARGDKPAAPGAANNPLGKLK